jgi:L-ascorbate metabolism protein UlaG (beta-lactamase superfamily)
LSRKHIFAKVRPFETIYFAMDITHLGHSSFMLKGKTATVVTDPFDPKKVGIKYPKVSADIVTVSHDHDDHNNAAAVSDVKKVISGPGEYEINEVSIIGLSSYHDAKKGEDRGRNTIYVFEMDGVRLVHLGDLGHELTEKTVDEMGEVNVLMIPVGGVYTIDSKQASEVAKSIEANIVIPMHYKTAKKDEKTFGKLEGYDAFLSEVGLSVEKEKKLKVKSSDFVTDEQKAVVLQTK